MCGDKKVELTPDELSRGSPPHMRGKGSIKGYALKRAGITPAYAGKRARRRSMCPCSRDHPRICGEKLSGKKLTGVGIGSPPHMRGKGSQLQSGRRRYRITPACAGKRHRTRRRTPCLWDHPRMCGEKARTLIVQNEPQGSPPHVRGKVFI